MRRLVICIGLHLAAFTSGALAAPVYTAYFEGVTTYFWSYDADAYIGSRVGLRLSGYYTFDLSHGYPTANHDPIGNVIGVGRQSSAGCIWSINGSCLTTAEITPVITAYSIFTPFGPPEQVGTGAPPSLAGGYEPYPESLNIGDVSAIGQGEREGVQTYSASRDQIRRNVSGYNGAYDVQGILRSFSVFLQGNTGSLYSNLEDLAAEPDLGQANLNNWLFYRNSLDSSECADWRDTATCMFTGWGVDSFYFFGRLTSVTIVPGPATPRRLPEPGSLALLTGCLGALILTGQRRTTAA